jgi:RNA polymerase sigma factor (sigma-70 family)
MKRGLCWACKGPAHFTMDFEKEFNKYINTIHFLAKRMYLESSVCDKDDLIQAGLIGMMDGIRSFSEARSIELKVKKSSYVIGCIRNAMLEEANKFYGPLRLPHRKKLRLNAFKKLFNDNTSAEEIKTILRMSDIEYAEMLRLSKQSRNKTIELSSELIDEDSDTYEIMSIHDISLKHISLTDDERKILELRINNGLTYDAIGKIFGVKRETMRQRVLNIINKIKKGFKSE